MGRRGHVPVLGKGERVVSGWEGSLSHLSLTSKGASLSLRPHTPLSLNPASCIPVGGRLVPRLPDSCEQAAALIPRGQEGSPCHLGALRGGRCTAAL